MSQVSQVWEVREPVVLQVEDAELIHPVQVWAFNQVTTKHTHTQSEIQSKLTTRAVISTLRLHGGYLLKGRGCKLIY